VWSGPVLPERLNRVVTRYAIGLGSNVGDRLGHLVAACATLGARPAQVSSLYETEPVGGPEQGPFLNAVALLDTDSTPLEVLDRLQEIENDHGRVREQRWGPRTLDLDLIVTDAGPHHDDRLVSPHPRAAEREFVLRPLVELWPDAPVAPGVTAEEALSALSGQGVDLLARDWVPPVSPTKGRLYVAGQFALFLAVALAIVIDGSLPQGAITAWGVTGALLAVAGMILGLAGWRWLGVAMTPSPVPKQGAALVVSGPYRLVRHPVYGGVTLMLMGTSLLLDSIWGFAIALLLIPYFWVKSSYEERQLRMRYPGYREYRTVVRRRLIPFVV
jgi:2-amino-4-hydroxy-6-hydroxymethyldihydropteridine diphosphokinase